MDFIKIDYTGKVKDVGVFDTTDQEVAKKEGIFDEKRVYRPLPVTVGEGQVIKGLDEALATMKQGEEKTVEITPDKGYGERDKNLVRLVPMKLFKQQKINPVPGMPVELDGRMARIQTVSGGRVRVDFNHDLAGKTLVFDVKVIAKAATEKDKVLNLVDRSFNSPVGFDVKITGKKAEVILPADAYRDRNILARKASLAADLFRLLGISHVTYTEVWENPKVTTKKEDKGKVAAKREDKGKVAAKKENKGK